MLDQIVLAGSLPARCRDDLANRIKLVVAGEDHRFLHDPPLPALAIVNLVLGLLDEHEVAENIEEAVALQHFFPKVARAVARRMLRVPGTALHFSRMTA